MKEKVVEFIKNNRGGFALLLIVFVVTSITAIITSLSGVNYTTVLFTSQDVGILSMLLVSVLYKTCSQKPPMGLEWGILGMLLSILLTKIFY